MANLDIPPIDEVLNRYAGTGCESGTSGMEREIRCNQALLIFIYQMLFELTQEPK